MNDNELIAGFMGLRYNRKDIEWYDPEGDGMGANLHYKTSWDWLMPVVEKVETLYDTGIFYDGIRGPDVHNVRVYAKRGGSETIVVEYGKSKIDTVYKAIVEFIKWHNQQKQ